MVPAPAIDAVVAFYSGGADDRGRTLEQILGWSDDELEYTHDYVQWVFPTVQPSGVNPGAPLVTGATVAAFGSHPELGARLRAAFARMLRFYGLRLSGRDGDPRVGIDEARFAGRARNWLRPYNHNHLRLTRIMQSLAVLGLEAEALALQRCLLDDVPARAGRDRIAPETFAYWRDAVPGGRQEGAG